MNYTTKPLANGPEYPRPKNVHFLYSTRRMSDDESDMAVYFSVMCLRLYFHKAPYVNFILM